MSAPDVADDAAASGTPGADVSRDVDTPAGARPTDATESGAPRQVAVAAAAPPPRGVVPASRVDLSIVAGARLLGGASKAAPGPAATMRLDAVPPAASSATAGTSLAAAPSPSRGSSLAATPSAGVPQVPTPLPPVAPRRTARRALRALPLAATLAVGVAATAAGWARQEHAAAVAAVAASPPPPAPLAAPEGWTALPAATVPIGLTEDAKELVLSLCFRVSDDWRRECSPSYLRGLGEYPHRDVPFAALDVQTFEASNGAWGACVAAGACALRDIDACEFHSAVRGWEPRTKVPASMLTADRPAVCATHDEAAAFCAWAGGRLPTAEEWERVARSGDDRLQPWGRFVMPGLMNWGERALGAFPIPGRLDGHETSAPVDAFRGGATDDGVRNLLGNASEWVEPRDGDPAGHAGVRGGSYADDVRELRLTFHSTLPAASRRSTVGFRCVRDTR